MNTITSIAENKFKNLFLLKEYIYFTLSSFVFNGAKFLIEMIAAKKLGPQVYGIWATMLLLITYSANFHLGILNALGREIPVSIPKGENHYVQKVKTIGFRAILCTIVAFTLFIIIYLLFSDFKLFYLPALFLVFYFTGQQFYQFTQVVLRSELQFNTASKQQIFAGILILMIACPLLYFWNLDGLILGYAISFLTCSLLFMRLVKPVGDYSINREQVYALIKIGLPIMAVGYAYAVITSIDRWIVVARLGTKEMGLYSFSYTLFSIGMFFLSTLATQMYPRLSLQFGKNGSHADTFNLLRTQIKITIIAGSLASLFLFLVLFISVSRFLPHYTDSLEVAEILLGGLPFLGVALTITGFFNVIKQQKLLVLPIFLTLAISLILSLTALDLGYGKEGVATATTISYIFFSFSLFMLSKRFAFQR